MKSFRGMPLAVVAAAGGIVAGLGSVGVAGADPSGTVYHVANTGGWDLNVRSDPSLSGSIIGELPAGATVAIACQTTGDEVNGVSNIWDELGPGRYVSDYYVDTPGVGTFTDGIPQCPGSPPPSPPSPPPPPSPPSPPNSYDCPGAGQPVATAFPRINVPVRIPGKSYSLSYGKLNLSWSSVSPTGGAQCSMQSSSGALPLILNLPLVGSRTVGYSVTTARLDFLANGVQPPLCDWKNVTRNCSLNGDGPLMVRWSTPGFREQVGGRTVYDSGPFTFYVQVNSGDVAAELPRAELYIHETLIAHLPTVMPLALVQEPPADVWVRDAHGRVTGRTPRGRVLHQIPNSEYFTNGRGYAAVLLLTARSPRYTTAAIGRAGGAYSLSISTVSPSGTGAASARSAMKSGRLGSSGSLTLRFIPND